MARHTRFVVAGSLLLLLLLLTAGLIVTSPRPGPANSLTSGSQAAARPLPPTRSSARQDPGKAVQLRPRSSAPRSLTDPTALGLGLAEQHARRIVTNAFRCEKFISGLIDNLPTERQNARRQLEGLREKLFVDDWRLAAHYAPSIDASKAEEALASLIDTPGTTEIAAVLDRYSRSAQPAASGDGDSLADHYQRLLEGRNPEYRQVAEVVDAHLSYPGQSAEDDLLKDAAMYVALRTQAIEWWEETSNSLSTSEQSFTGKMKEGAGGVQPEAVAGMGSFFQEAHEGLSQSFESQLGAIDQVFDWRFSEKHGMDGKALIADLGRLSLRGATGSDLSVPAP